MGSLGKHEADVKDDMALQWEFYCKATETNNLCSQKYSSRHPDSSKDRMKSISTFL